MRTALLSACIALAAAPARAQTTQSVNTLETWITAVKTHQPGKVDPALSFIGALKYSDRRMLDPAMTIFLAAVGGKPIVVKSDAGQTILEMYHAVRGNPGPAAFVERAAMLHADAAIFRDKLPDFVDDAPPPNTRRVDHISGLPLDMRNRAPNSPLLANDLAMVHTDGRVVGERVMNWNWTFARSLLDLLVTAPGKAKGSGHSDVATDADVVFVAEWYHATAAYQMAMGKHADLNAQLARAALILPAEPHVLFDRACYAEMLGLPLYQVLPADAGYWKARAHVTMDVPSEDKTDDEAEKLFRQAIAVDPTYAEARVRLARLLERRGVHDEAATQVEQALAANPPKTVAYFVHIVGGRTELARGHADKAVEHYRAALALFPDAQSALLGASDAAVMNSDVAGALALVQELGARTASFEADPWWRYHIGAGRDVDALMAALWSRVSR